MKTKNIAVLVSGGGTNLQAIIDAYKAGKITNGKLALVLSSNEKAYALERAANNGIESCVVKKGNDREAFSDAILAKLEEKNIEFRVYVKPTIPKVLHGDETHVRQIFTNILNNAVKYTKTGFVELNVDWEQRNGMALIRVSVEDSGCGIAENEKSHLFDKFYQADTSHKSQAECQ